MPVSSTTVTIRTRKLFIMTTIKKSLLIIVIFYSIKYNYAVQPGTFFWKPRLAIDLTVPSTSPSPEFSELTRGNIQEGIVVMINGYELGMTLMTFVSGVSNSKVMPTLNPLSASFYTNVYRWGLRHFSMMPQWVGGTKTYYETTEAWKRRFYFLDTFFPKFLRPALPYVTKEDWEREEKDMVLFKKYAEHAFGKGYRYPNKKFNNFKSWETEESKERLELSSISTEELQG